MPEKDESKGPVILLASPGRTIGGYFVRTLRILKRLYELYPDQKFILITPKGDPLAKEDLPPSVVTYESGFMKRSLIHRTLWIQLFLPYFCKKTKASNVMGMGCYGPRWTPCDQAILVNNSRLVSPIFWTIKNIPLKTKIFVLLQRFFFGWALKGCTRIGVQRPGVIDEIQDLWKIPKKRFVSVPNSSSISEDKKPLEKRMELRKLFPGRVIFLFPSLYARHKNFEILQIAMELYIKKRPEGPHATVCLTLDENSGGHEAGADLLVRRIKGSEAKDQFYFIGEAPHPYMRSLYEEADVILYPSIVDSFSVVFLDAMKCKKPILAADLPHAKDVCGECAEYFIHDDPQSLCDAIDRLVVDESRRQELADKGSVLVDKFSHAEELKGMIKLLGINGSKPKVSVNVFENSRV